MSKYCAAGTATFCCVKEDKRRNKAGKKNTTSKPKHRPTAISASDKIALICRGTRLHDTSRLIKCFWGSARTKQLTGSLYKRRLFFVWSADCAAQTADCTEASRPFVSSQPLTQVCFFWGVGWRKRCWKAARHPSGFSWKVQRGANCANMCKRRRRRRPLTPP